MRDGALFRRGRLALSPREVGTAVALRSWSPSAPLAFSPFAHAAVSAAPETTITGGPAEGSELRRRAPRSRSRPRRRARRSSIAHWTAPRLPPAPRASPTATSARPPQLQRLLRRSQRQRGSDAGDAHMDRHRVENVYTVPASVPTGCSTDATSQILSWIASVPNNSTLRFGASACYRIEGTIELHNRNLELRRQRLDVQVAERPDRPARDVAGMGLDRQLPQHDDHRVLHQRRRHRLQPPARARDRPARHGRRGRERLDERPCRRLRLLRARGGPLVGRRPRQLVPADRPQRRLGRRGRQHPRGARDHRPDRLHRLRRRAQHRAAATSVHVASTFDSNTIGVPTACTRGR